MKKTFASLFMFFGVLILSFSTTGQDKSKVSPPLPDDINKIISVSCVPCHTNNGKLMSRALLNFSEWTQYSVDKQKAKAEKILSLLEKGEMPPKSARESRPEIIPTKEQIEVIKRWVESLKAGNK